MGKVLILHNNKLRLKELHHAFVKAGYDVLFAKDGVYGEQLFFEEIPDCVIADILLSGKSGSDLALSLRNSKEGRLCPIILTSPQFRRMQLEETAKAKWNIDRYFCDPYDQDELIQSVKELIVFYEKEKAKADAQPEQELQEGDWEPTDEPKSAGDTEPAPVITPEFETRPQSVKPQKISELLSEVDDALAEAAKEAADDLYELTGVKPKAPEPKKQPLKVPEKETAPKIAPRAKTLKFDKKPRLEKRPAAATRIDPSSEKATKGTVESIPAEGDLEQVSIPEIFATICIQRMDGTLEVRNDVGTVKIVYFRNGIPVYVESDFREETLGQVLVKHGIISEDTSYLSLKNMAGYRKKQGGALLEMGALTPMQLYQGLKLQVREKLLSLFAWSEGSFYFDPGKIDTSSLTVFEIDPVPLILEGLKECFRPDLIRSVFEQTKGALIRVKWSDEQTAGFSLTEDCVRMLEIIDGKSTISEVFKLSGLEEYHSGIVLYTLWLLGAYERSEVSEEESPESAEEKDDYDSLLSDELESIPQPTEKSLEPIEEDIEIHVDEAFDNLVKEALTKTDEATDEPEAQKTEPVETLPPPRKIVSSTDDINSLDAVFRQLEEQMEDRRRSAVEGEDRFVIRSEKLQKPSKEEETDPESESLRDLILTDYMALENSNYYEIMRLDRKVTEREVKDRYRQMAKQLHADKIMNLFGIEIVEKANEIMARVTEAYQTLGERKRRREYDKRLSPEGYETRERHISTILAAEHEFNFGTAAMNRSDWETAREHFLTAVENFPEESAYHAHLGWAIYHCKSEGKKIERSTRATQYLERAIRINPKSDKPYYFLGIILRDNGYTDKAAKMFAQAFRYNRKNTKAQHELRTLQHEKEQQRIAAVKKRRKAQGKDTESTIRNFFQKDFNLLSMFRKKK